MIREAYDKLFQELNIGDHVAYALQSRQYIGVVKKITPRRIRIKVIGVTGCNHWEALPRENQLIRITEEAVAFYLLKRNDNEL
jgi:hypothetical protein